MHIVLWQNALCTFDEHFLCLLPRKTVAKSVAKVCLLQVLQLFAKTDVFPVVNLKNFGWASCRLIIQKGR